MALDVRLLVNDLLCLFPIKPFLGNCVFQRHSVLLLPSLQRHLEQVALLAFCLVFEGFFPIFFVDQLLELGVHLALVPAQLQVRFFLLSVEYFTLVLDDSAPFVELSVLRNRVVPLLLLGQSLDLLKLLVKRLFYAVRHL